MTSEHLPISAESFAYVTSNNFPIILLSPLIKGDTGSERRGECADPQLLQTWGSEAYIFSPSVMFKPSSPTPHLDLTSLSLSFLVHKMEIITSFIGVGFDAQRKPHTAPGTQPAVITRMTPCA